VTDLFTHLAHGHRDQTSMDTAHAALIASVVLASKPARVLELGVGTGYVSKAILLALRFNGRGSLTCVDDWHDWSGRRPVHIDGLEAMGAGIVLSSEAAFVRSCAAGHFDLVVSDADHFNAHQWFEDTLRLVAPSGVAFFHDTNQPEVFPGLATLPSRATESGLPSRHYMASSRGDERCDRGLLMVLNRPGQA